MIRSLAFIALVGLLPATKAAAQAESDMDSRKFRFGLMAAPNFGWIKPNIPEFEKDGLQPRMGFGYGVMMDYKFSDSPNYLFSTGFNLTTNGGALIEPWETKITESGTSYRFLGENKRTYRLQYINVPLLLKMRTGNMGYMSYFGAIGLDAGFRTRARVNNDYTWTTSSLTSLQPADEKDLDYIAHTNFMRAALNITLGAEYNVSGNTNIYAGIGLHNGFTNMFNNKNANKILKPDNNGSPALTTGGGAIISQQKKAGYYYISLDLGVFF